MRLSNISKKLDEDNKLNTDELNEEGIEIG